LVARGGGHHRGKHIIHQGDFDLTLDHLPYRGQEVTGGTEPTADNLGQEVLVIPRGL
jgi:hypothetical protein